MQVVPFSLNELRGTFTPQFAEWDRCADTADSLRAKAVRRVIKRLASSSLEIPEAAQPGFYVFMDDRSFGISQIQYVGIAKTVRRPIRGRIVDRLRDDSGLDTALDGVSDDEFRRVVSRRLLTALPQSGLNYVEKHLSVAKLFRRSSMAAIIPCNAGETAIVEAEKALIGSAALAGAPLFNRQNRSYRGTLDDGIHDLASEVIDACSEVGLRNDGAEDWKSALSSLR